MNYKIISFDFDHTLTSGDSAFEHLSKFLGIEQQTAEIEESFKQGNITTNDFADMTAGLLKGSSVDDVSAHMLQIPLIAGVAEMIQQLNQQGVISFINTIGYQALLQPFIPALGVSAVSGVELEITDGKFTGNIISYFPLEAKISYAENFAKQHGYGLADILSVGDGLSDIPLFKATGASIAFNSNNATKAMATDSAEGRDTDALMAAIQRLLKPN